MFFHVLFSLYSKTNLKSCWAPVQFEIKNTQKHEISNTHMPPLIKKRPEGSFGTYNGKAIFDNTISHLKINYTKIDKNVS